MAQQITEPSFEEHLNHSADITASENQTSSAPRSQSTLSQLLAPLRNNPAIPRLEGPVRSLDEALANLTPDGYIDWTQGPIVLGSGDSRSSEDTEKHLQFIHTTQHDAVEDCYIICQIMSEKRAAGLRWFKIDREADFIIKKQATRQQIKEWKEYQAAHPNAEEDREMEYAEKPFETPSILSNCFGEEGELVGYVRSYAPLWEPEEHLHEELVRIWEGTEVFRGLKVENGWES